MSEPIIEIPMYKTLYGITKALYKSPEDIAREIISVQPMQEIPPELFSENFYFRFDYERYANDATKEAPTQNDDRAEFHLW